METLCFEADFLLSVQGDVIGLRGQVHLSENLEKYFLPSARTMMIGCEWVFQHGSDIPGRH